ncbi:patatin-like phospholipase RssA [Halorhodospira halochloris]|uniref:patatin-like phospholipase RssA n=1 Tax=Halorhodospira halochloris TaxID=1052 RepID=UPI001EE96031|nr:patatin-like phospholipase RssA [Halorhodospira halochloris]MCG5529959.1 patatin-like phospholipase RssA [Halorhodospira halochloris]
MEQQQNTAKPRIGLALGSGSARGWSHIGVIRALEKAGVEPAVVAGTSIGALVGAFYAAGQLDALEPWVRNLGRREVIGMLDPKLRGSGGLIEGQRLHDFYHEHLAGADLESLPVRFAAVATTLGRGAEVWLHEGDVADAVRASTALPGILSPVPRGKDWLVDGGLVNPVPVSVCRAFGADVVIAVNLNGDLVGRHIREPTHHAGNHSLEMDKLIQQLPKGMRERAQVLAGLWDSWSGGAAEGQEKNPAPGVFEVLAGSLNIMQDRITRSRMAGDPPELLLSPRLAHIGLLEFHRAEEAIGIGESIVERMMPSINDLLGHAK